MRTLATLLVLGILLILAVGISNFGAPANGASGWNSSQAVNAVRAVNTLEMNFKAREKHYAAADQLVSAGDSTSRMVENLIKPNQTGYALIISPSADGQHYLLFLKASDVNKKSFFSDDSGLIFEGSPIR
ncbi:MAG: hypothetical protein PHX83_12460 [Acidobacteriia bacterium]|nr:hypothetical protein [Terriglobia bacterium]